MLVRHATVKRGNAGAMYSELIAGKELISIRTKSDIREATSSHDTRATISKGSYRLPDLQALANVAARATPPNNARTGKASR